jgi:hypothetical protein
LGKLKRIEGVGDLLLLKLIRILSNCFCGTLETGRELELSWVFVEKDICVLLKIK